MLESMYQFIDLNLHSLGLISEPNTPQDIAELLRAFDVVEGMIELLDHSNAAPLDKIESYWMKLNELKREKGVDVEFEDNLW